MSERTTRTTRTTLALTATAALGMGLTACGDSGGGEAGGDITLQFASSQSPDQPNYYCGMELFKERIEEQDLGITVDLFPSSQLGPDAERVSQIQSGDIDLDLQEAGMTTVYPQLGILGAAYVFDDVDHAFNWIDEHSEEFRQDFSDATDMTIIDGWYYGSRTFSSNEPIRTPDDLQGQLIRFPDTPQYLANAEAMGAQSVAVAYEEIYVALQQGIADGQENPVVGTATGSYDEVQDYVSLNNHQISIHWVTLSNQTLEQLSDEQREAVFTTVHEIRDENRQCVDEETEEVLQEWRDSGQLTVIEEDEVDRQAFIDKAQDYFENHYTGEDLEFYQSIRDSAE